MTQNHADAIGRIMLGRATSSSREGLDRRSFLRFAAVGAGTFALGAPGIWGARDAFADPSASESTLSALAGAQASYDEAVSQLNVLGEQVETAQYELSQTQAQLDETNASIADLQTSIEAKQAELAQAQDVLADRISANYKLGRADVVSMLLDASDFDDLVTRVYYAGKVSDSDAKAIDTVKTLKAELQSQQDELTQRKAEQEQLLTEQQAQTDELQSQVDGMQQYVSSLSAEVQQLLAQKAAEEAAAAEEQRRQLEAQLAAEQAAQQQTAADAGSGAGTSGGSVDNGYVPDAGGDSGSGSSSGGSSSGGSSSGTGNHASGAAGVAWNYIGVPYVWGGTDPSGFDCSGLAQYCYAMCGYSIPRDTYSQIAQIQALGNWKTSMDELAPGDLVFPHSGHVGIYQGGGMMIHAPAPGRSVEYISVYGFMGGGSPV